jgi:hypothetical protein
MFVALMTGAALAGDAHSSATAGSGRNGPAVATAGYTGEVGFARTDSRSGPVNLARGVAVGVDENGLSLSVSHAVATPRGPAVATNFNLSIGTNGEVSHSTGTAISTGGRERSASAGGSTATRIRNGGSVSFASGRAARNGTVVARTDATHDRSPRLTRSGAPLGPRPAIVKRGRVSDSTARHTKLVRRSSLVVRSARRR